MTRTVAAFALVLALSAAVPTAGARGVDRWPAGQERAYLASCKATSGGRVAACRCTLAWLERRYTYNQIAALYLHDQARLRSVLVRAVQACS